MRKTAEASERQPISRRGITRIETGLGNTRKESRRALDGCRVLDLTDAQGVLCTRILTDLGADVIKVEKPCGDPMRLRRPFYRDDFHPEKSLFWFLFNAGKKSLTLDLDEDADRDTFLRLAESSDIVVECFKPGYMEGLGLGYAVLSRLNPGVILTSITPFGQTGPYSGYKGSDIVGQATGGLMALHGDPDRPPLRITTPVAHLLTGAQAAVGTLIAYYHRQVSGQGQQVDVSVQACAAFGSPYHFIYWDADKSVPVRLGSKAQVHRRAFETLFRTKDGFVAGWLGIMGDEPGRRLIEWMTAEGMNGDLCSEGTGDQPLLMRTQDMTQQEIEHREDLIREFVARYTTAEFVRKAQELRIEITPLYDIKQVVENEQFASRGFFVDIPHRQLGASFRYPNSPFFKMSGSPGQIWRSAPSIGEHNQEVLRFVKDNLHRTGKLEPSGSDTNSRALEGLKILDFSWQGIGPLTTRHLAHHGATVVRVESSTRLDLQRANGPMKDGIESVERSGMFSMWNSNKLGMTLNLKHKKGMEVAGRLIKWADVLVSSFSGGSMDRMGLGYETARAVNPKIIDIEISMAGQTGPWRHFRGHGQQLGAMSGLGSLLGWPDRGPLGQPWAFTDWFVPHFATCAILAALEYRRRTGEGQFIDLSQLEAVVCSLEAASLDYTANGRVLEATGNRLPYEDAAPHGAYRCRGDDKWCAIAVFTEEEWRSLCVAMGSPEWSRGKNFATAASRAAHADELDLLVEQWTRNFAQNDLMSLLQGVGVPAGAVLGGQDLCRDPQLSHRHQIWELVHPEMGRTAYFGPTFILSETPGDIGRPTPCLGEHNEYVCRHILNMPDEEFVTLLAEDVFR